jgi:hypothetical protein
VTIPYRGSQGPLNLLIDSTGIKAEGEGEWHARKHGGAKRRLWRKIHIGVDEQTLETRAVEITGSHIGGAPILPELLIQIPENEEIASVTAVVPQGLRPFGAETVHRTVSRPPLTTRKCHDAIADGGSHAVIPRRKNAKPWKTVTAGAVARNDSLRACR